MILNNGKDVYYEKIKPQLRFFLKPFLLIKGDFLTPQGYVNFGVLAINL